MVNAIEPAAALAFADQLRSARESAIKDVEAFGAVIHAIERLGSYRVKEAKSLSGYKKCLEDLFPWSQDDHGPESFRRLYDAVTEERNDAVHQGAYARHLTLHTIELALQLEEVLRNMLDPIVENYMVRNPICAELWQPIRMIRQQMLANSFSFLPLKINDDQWGLLSDTKLALHLRQDPSLRKTLMDQSLEKSGIKPDEAKIVSEKDELTKAVKYVVDGPVLVHRENDKSTIVGILTAFDML